MNRHYRLLESLNKNALIVQIDLSLPLVQIEKMVSLLLANGVQVLSFGMVGDQSLDHLEKLMSIIKEGALVGVHGLMDDYQARLAIKKGIAFISSLPYSQAIQQVANQQGVPYLADCETRQEMVIARTFGAELIRPNRLDLLQLVQHLKNALVCLEDPDLAKLPKDINYTPIRLVRLTELADNQLKANLDRCLQERQPVSQPAVNQPEAKAAVSTNLSAEEVNQLMQLLSQRHQNS